MAKTLTEIQKESDEKRGVRNKSFKLHNDDIDFITQSAQKYGLKQNELVVLAVRHYVESVLEK